MSDWFTIRATAGGTDVDIAGEITPADVPRFCAALPPGGSTIRLRVDSPGGDPSAAISIAQMLRSRPAPVLATVPRAALSAATLVLCGAARVTMAPSAIAMVHSPRLIADRPPPSEQARQAATAELGRIRERMLDVYAWRLRGGRAAIARMMDATTWLDPAEAVQLGLADEVAPAVPTAIAASFDVAALEALGEIPQRFRVAASALVTGGRLPTTASRGLDIEEIYRRFNQPVAEPFNALTYYQRGAR